MTKTQKRIKGNRDISHPGHIQKVTYKKLCSFFFWFLENENRFKYADVSKLLLHILGQIISALAIP